MPSQGVAFQISRSIGQRPIKPGFEWSLRPLIILNRFIGIHLDFPFCSSSKPLFQRISWWLITIFGFVLFFLNAEGNFSNVGDLINSSLMTKNKSRMSSTLVWNNVIELFNSVGTLVGTHAIFIAFSLTDWRHLAKLFLVMEQRNLFNEKDYKRFRRIASGGALVFITVTSIWVIIMLICWPSKLSVMFQLNYIKTQLSPMFVYSGMCLFGSFCVITYAMLNIVRKQITTNCSKRGRLRDEHDFWCRQLTMWKIQYYFIGEFVYHINQCFGSFLLILLTSYFVRMINISFLFLYSFIRQSFHFSKHHTLNMGLFAFYLVQDFIHFSVIVYLPYLIKQEAIKLNKKLRKLYFDDDLSLQNQVDFLNMEISLSLPEITAAGLFDLDCRLVPTFLGTTLTYLIILYQFDSIEKNTVTGS